MKPRITAPLMVVLTLASATFVTGCGSIKETVYLNDLSVRGPMTQPAVHLTDSAKAGEFHLSPRLSTIARRSFESRIEGNIYSSSSYYTSTGNNFRWSLPSAQYGLDLDYMASERLAVNVGMDFAPSEVGDFTSAYLGLGLPFVGKTVSGRFEVGARIQNMWYDAYSVLVREETSYSGNTTTTTLGYYHDINRAVTWNMYTALTFNSHGDGPVNFFCSAAVSRQTLTDFQPSSADANGPLMDYHYTDTRAEQTATVLSIAPGAVFTVSPTVKVLAGARLMWPAGLGDSVPAQVVPLLQFDIAF